MFLKPHTFGAPKVRIRQDHRDQERGNLRPVAAKGTVMRSATIRTPAEVARAVFDAVINKDLDGIVALGAPGYVEDFVAIGEMKGPDAIRGFFREMFAAFPDLEMTVDRIVADETAAVVQWHWTGTFTGGSFQGIQPTGRHVELRGVDVMEIADGLIRRNTVYTDGAGLARQIGMLPSQGSRADRALVSIFNAKSQFVRWRG